jgi:hypothetical protein
VSHSPEIALAGPLANAIDRRVELLHKLLVQGVAYLSMLRSEGVAKTNFMLCDATSIYVFEYLFSSPLKISTGNILPLRRSRNNRIVRELVAMLCRNGFHAAAQSLDPAIEASDVVRINDHQASTEMRICYMIEAHTLISGILKEVLDKELSNALSADGAKVRAYAILPQECMPSMAYVSQNQLLDALALELSNAGYAKAADMIVNQKGRSYW